MGTQVFEAIYTGVYSDIDPDELNTAAEDAGFATGYSFGSPASPAYLGIVTLTMTDANDDGTSEENDLGTTPDTLTMGGVTHGIDSISEYAVTLTYADGSTATTRMGLLQDTGTRLFLVPLVEGSPYNAALDDAPIVSIHMDAMIGNDYTGLAANPEPDAFVTCFVAGTLVDTPTGPKDVARLRPGDLVMTHDAGPQEVVLATLSRVTAQGRGAPVRIARDALGPGVPSRDVEVSRQHRVLVASPIVTRIFGVPEVLVRAKDLVGLPGITLAERAGEVCYHHVMTARHHLLTTQGMVSETLWPGPMALSRMTAAQRARALALYPRIEGRITVPSARPLVQGRACHDLVRRHGLHGKPLQPAAVAVR